MEDKGMDLAKMPDKINNTGNKLFSNCLQLFTERNITLPARLQKKLKQICRGYADNRQGS